MASRPVDRVLAPRIALVVAALFIALIFVLTPNSSAGPLTSYSAGPYGSRGLWELLHRLGWRVERRVVPLTAPLDTSAIYAVLDPPLPLSTNEVRDLLAAVRHGASALVVPHPNTPLADSLHIAQSQRPMMPYAVVDTTRRGEDATDTTAAAADSAAAVAQDTIMGRVDMTALDVFWSYLNPSAPLPAGTVTFVAVHDRKEHVRPAVLGIPFGRGRLVVVADPRIFRNRVVRTGDAAVLDTRLIEWLTRSPHPVLVFDEYHHGYGDHGSLRHALGRAMFGTPSGRMLTQALVGALVLLAALGIRAIPPSPRSRVERRSPIEHADALARAYEQVGATRTATRRLLHGLRRRHPFGAHGADDDAFLDALRSRHPSLATDVELVRGAIRQPLAPNAFLAVGAAINHMERMLAS